MAKFPKILVDFNDGTEPLVVQTTSRDALRLEREGYALDALPGIEGSYRLAYTCVARLIKSGTLDRGWLSFEEFSENVDFDPVEDGDPEGKGSVPAPTTGWSRTWTRSSCR